MHSGSARGQRVFAFWGVGGEARPPWRGAAERGREARVGPGGRNDISNVLPFGAAENPTDAGGSGGGAKTTLAPFKLRVPAHRTFPGMVTASGPPSPVGRADARVGECDAVSGGAGSGPHGGSGSRDSRSRGRCPLHGAGGTGSRRPRQRPRGGARAAHNSGWPGGTMVARAGRTPTGVRVGDAGERLRGPLWSWGKERSARAERLSGGRRRKQRRRERGAGEKVGRAAAVRYYAPPRGGDTEAALAGRRNALSGAG